MLQWLAYQWGIAGNGCWTVPGSGLMQVAVNSKNLAEQTSVIVGILRKVVDKNLAVCAPSLLDSSYPFLLPLSPSVTPPLRPHRPSFAASATFLVITQVLSVFFYVVSLPLVAVLPSLTVQLRDTTQCFCVFSLRRGTQCRLCPVSLSRRRLLRCFPCVVDIGCIGEHVSVPRRRLLNHFPCVATLG